MVYNCFTVTFSCNLGNKTQIRQVVKFLAYVSSTIRTKLGVVGVALLCYVTFDTVIQVWCLEPR